MHIPLELSRLESKLRLHPVKAGGWAVETPLIMLSHPEFGGRRSPVGAGGPEPGPHAARYRDEATCARPGRAGRATSAPQR